MAETASAEEIEVIDTIMDKTQEIPSMTKSELIALKTLPEQFVKSIPEEDGWTTQLHIWAGNGERHILSLEPKFLAFNNSFGDSVLMSLMNGALGAYNGKVDYELIWDILNTPMDFTRVDGDNEETLNVLDIKDIMDMTPIDILIDFAHARGQYTNTEPDYILISLIEQWSNGSPEFVYPASISEIGGIDATNG